MNVSMGTVPIDTFFGFATAMGFRFVQTALPPGQVARCEKHAARSNARSGS